MYRHCLRSFGLYEGRYVEHVRLRRGLHRTHVRGDIGGMDFVVRMDTL